MKKGLGKTGVPLQYHKEHEWKKLSGETNEDKTALAKESPNRSSKKSKGGGNEKSNILSVVQAEVAKPFADKTSSEPSVTKYEKC